MAFTLRLQGEFLLAAVTCDQCGDAVPAAGFFVWNANSDPDNPADGASVQLCSDECLDAFAERQPENDEWLATPLDAYLANLATSLNVDLAAVLEREEAVWAAEQTRHEAPD